jgi:phytoene dehydrogenase-like protein
VEDAVVIGAGPNGLAAAIAIAETGRSVLVLEAQPTIGGGTRTSELTLPGFRHDVCSAIHPSGAASPFFRRLPLHEHGLEWLHPDVMIAHPLEDGSAAVLMRDVEETAAGLGADAGAYRRLIGPLARRWSRIEGSVLGPLTHPPRHPLAMARFGLRALPPASLTARRFKTPQARGLWAGMAAHAFLPLEKPLTSAAAALLTLTGHEAGWPVAKGGSQAIPDALASYLRSLGGRIETSTPVKSLGDVPEARAILFDTSPRGAVDIAGDRMPARYRGKLERYRYGAGAFKVDWALSGPMPWTAEVCQRAGTVHIGGTFEEVARSERDVYEGRNPERPYMLVGQQSLVDPGRAPAGQHTLWAYCHVPNGSTFDMTERMEAQLDRFAPGWRDLVLARSVRTPADLEAYNANLIGGDVAGGATDGLQLALRPAVRYDPYRIPKTNMYLCSSSTPPGGGVHGMCGWLAAKSALRHLG